MWSFRAGARKHRAAPGRRPVLLRCLLPPHARAACDDERNERTEGYGDLDVGQLPTNHVRVTSVVSSGVGPQHAHLPLFRRSARNRFQRPPPEGGAARKGPRMRALFLTPRAGLEPATLRLSRRRVLAPPDHAPQSAEAGLRLGRDLRVPHAKPVCAIANHLVRHDQRADGAHEGERRERRDRERKRHESNQPERAN